MTKHKLALFLLSILWAPVFSNSGNSSVDLRPRWNSFRDGKFVPFAESRSDAVYISFASSEITNNKLYLNSPHRYFVLANGMLVGQYKESQVFKLDSLAKSLGAGTLTVTIYQHRLDPTFLETQLLLPSAANNDIARPPHFFNDFAVFSGLMIIAIFVATLRVNPKLASDYLSMQKMLSLKESDDSKSNARSTSSSNIQFYIISAMLCAFFLMITFQYLPKRYMLSSTFSPTSFWEALRIWLFATAFLLIIFLLKIILVSSLTNLFGFRHLARIHYFNWMRMLLFVLGSASTLLFVYFISRGFSVAVFDGFLIAVTSVFVLWIAVIFLKLNSRSEHSMFHLFSYICATEIIPLLIAIKVLFQ